MNYYLTLGGILFVYVTVWFVISLIQKRNDVADVAWGLGFVLLAWASLWLHGEVGVRQVVVTALVTIWGVRLAWHIHARHQGKPEDYRYRVWRETWGAWFYLRSYGQVYLLQGALLFLVVQPVLFLNTSAAASLGVLDLLGIFVWLVGFSFEVVGDAQLARFIRDPRNKGKLMKSGLWAYSRHPNYFGEVTTWWGLWLVALSVPYGWVSVVGPLTITFLILRVSGVPMLEAKMKENPEFEEYKRTVSMFVPLPKNIGQF